MKKPNPFCWPGLLAVLLLGSWSLVAGGAAAEPARRKAEPGIVDINKASSEELQRLPGIGPAKADRILEYRAKHPFRTVEELGRVKGIGPKTVRKLRLHLTTRSAAAAPSPAPAAAAAASAAVKKPPPAP